MLSLDGGGMRGTYTATYLERVAATFAKQRGITAIDIGGAFDLITGTSTGGIIACALTKGIPLREIVSLYRQHGAKIFSLRLPSTKIGVVPDMLKRREALAAGTAELKAALAAKLGTTTIGDIYKTRGIACDPRRRNEPAPRMGVQDASRPRNQSSG